MLTLQQGEAGAGERGDPLYLQGLGVRVFPEEQVYKQLLCFFGFWASSLLSSLHAQGFLKVRQQVAARSPVAHKYLIQKHQSRCVHKCFEVGLSVPCLCPNRGHPCSFPRGFGSRRSKAGACSGCPQHAPKVTGHMAAAWPMPVSEELVTRAPGCRGLVVLPLLTLSVSPQPVEATDDAFWDQFWADTATSVQDVFALVPAAEIRAVREESPSNLATLCYKVRLALPSPWCCAGRGCPCVAPRGS